MRVALIPTDGNVVANVVVVGDANFSPEGFDRVELPSDSCVTKGWVYDRTSGEFAEPARPATKEITPADFKRRFTIAEWVAAWQLSKTDGLMAYFFDTLRLVDVVHLDHQDTIQGVGLMVTLGIITQERAIQILSTQ